MGRGHVATCSAGLMPSPPAIVNRAFSQLPVSDHCHRLSTATASLAMMDPQTQLDPPLDPQLRGILAFAIVCLPD